jgi:hypothetical protein
LAGQDSHLLDDTQSFMESSHPPIPFDQHCLVALIFLYSRQFMSVIILMADRVLDSSRHKEVMNAKQRHLVAPEVVRFLG